MFGLVRRLAVLGVMVAVVGLVLWAGVYHWDARRAAKLKSQQNEVTLTPANSGVDQSFGTDLRGKPAPAFSLKDVNGKTVSLADYKGHPVVVNFWATYCGPCREEMPWFQEFTQKYAGNGQGLVVLGLDLEDGVTVEQVKKAAARTAVTYPILMADDKTATSYSLGDFLPVSFYVDKNGVVVEQTAGVGSKDQMEASVRKIVGGQ
jgi:thiol-disulfide isomerase/thioredoxin